MLSLEQLCAKVEAYAPTTDLDPLRDAYRFSEKAHQDQVRKSGEPYFSHPVEVAAILADMHLDVVCVSVGLLHDVVEDTLTTGERIRKLFGEDIANLVDGVTKMSQIQFSSKKEKQVENFRKLLLAMVDDIRVILVKLADRLHNMRTLRAMPEESRNQLPGRPSRSTRPLLIGWESQGSVASWRISPLATWIPHPSSGSGIRCAERWPTAMASSAE